MAETSTVGNLHLTSGRLLARNTVWNLIGNGAPLIVAVFSIPILIHGLGKDRFGVLTLAWALIGYASLFDIGLGRALTQLVAKKLGSGEDHEIPALVWTSLLLMFALGLAGAAVIIAISPWLVRHVLKVPEALQSEVVSSFRLLGLSVPLVILTAGLRGLLEAHQRFKLVNALRIPIGVFTFVGPLLVLPFSRSLVPVVGILVAGRLIGWLAHLLICFRVVPELRQRVAWHGPSAGPLLPASRSGHRPRGRSPHLVRTWPTNPPLPSGRGVDLRVRAYPRAYGTSQATMAALFSNDLNDATSPAAK